MPDKIRLLPLTRVKKVKDTFEMSLNGPRLTKRETRTSVYEFVNEHVMAEHVARNVSSEKQSTQ